MKNIVQKIKSYLGKISELKFVQSKKYEKVFKIIIIIIIALIIFQLGMIVGFRKAEFSGKMGDNYYRAFNGRGYNVQNMRQNIMTERPSMMPNVMQGISGGHGTVGKIIKVDLPTLTLTVESPDGIEKFVKIDNQTLIKKFKNKISAQDITTADYVIVLGEPNQNGEIHAKLIRILPPPPAVDSLPTTNQN